jgi:dihydroneopterin aldolase/2-amino-4-hydroxy-6-hydroxymethyldihydropteridine diphosphokinase
MIKYDEIRIDELEIFAHHGVYDFETQNGQKFYVNAVLYTDTHKAGATDELTDSTNYGEVCSFITDFLIKNTYKLLEAAAEKVTEAILLTFPLIKGVSFEIRKPEAPIGLPFGSVSVKIERFWHTAYIALGSNMGDKEKYLNMMEKS